MCRCEKYMCRYGKYMCDCGKYMCGYGKYMCGCEKYMCGCEKYMCGCEKYMCGCGKYMCRCNTTIYLVTYWPRLEVKDSNQGSQSTHNGIGLAIAGWFCPSVVSAPELENRGGIWFSLA